MFAATKIYKNVYLMFMHLYWNFEFNPSRPFWVIYFWI